MTVGRIDVHSHLIPQFWAEELLTHGGDPSGWYPPVWSPEQHLGFMDEQGIAVSMLSLTAPGIDGWAVGQERTAIVSQINDYGADLIKQHPDRFGYFASLALPDPDAALNEIRRACDELGVDGVTLHSNYSGCYLTDPRFVPLWEELNRRSAVVFIHPTTPHGVRVLEGLPGPIEDYPAETTRCAVDLVFRGYMERYSSARIILSHGGGFLPYAASRFAELLHSLHRDRSVADLMKSMRSFYFDTALVPESGLPSLLAFAPRGRVLFGTDYCYAPPDVGAIFTRNLDKHDFAPGDLDSLNQAALPLFPRLQRLK